MEIHDLAEENAFGSYVDGTNICHETAGNGEGAGKLGRHNTYFVFCWLLSVSPTVIYVKQLAWVMWGHQLLCLFVLPKEQWKIKHLHRSITRLSILETNSQAQKKHMTAFSITLNWMCFPSVFATNYQFNRTQVMAINKLI